MTTLYEIINRANQIAAGRVTDTENSMLADSEMTSEALFEHAMRYVFAEIIKKGERLEDIRRVHTISFVSGEGTLPETVVRAAVKYGYVDDPTVAYLPPHVFTKKTRFRDLISHFTVIESVIKYREAGKLSFTGDADFRFVTMPDKNAPPNGYLDDLDLDKSVVDDIVLVIAGALTGEIKIQELLDNQIY